MKRFKVVATGLAGGAATVGIYVALADSPSMGPVKLSPQHYTVRLDNDCVRVLEYRLKPGQKEILHSHPKGVVIALADATVRTTLADGTVAAHPSANGDVTWRDALTHSAENIGATEAHYIAVELKSCAR
jgi:beta-alanine degradation protein BauB